MRKINNENENFIDNFLLDIAEYVSPIFYDLGFTPNDITTLSLITGLLCVYFLYTKNILIFTIFFILSYFFDCLDGHFARKYNMVSKFGDMYDHVKDTAVHIILYSTIIYLYYNNIYIIPVSIAFITFIILSAIHLTCQQVLYSGMEVKDEYLDQYIHIFEFFGIKENTCKDMIKYTKFVGVGTLQLVIILLIIFLERTTI